MKVSKSQVRENRAHIVETASMLFRKRGYDGVSVADLMEAAGFTHGGFYKHFASKTDLMAEAATCGLAQTASQSADVDALTLIEQYLSREHRDGVGTGCTLAALGGDAARQPKSVKQAFAAGIETHLATPEPHPSGKRGSVSREARAAKIAALAQAVGALVLSRACPDDSPLADEILETCRSQLLARSVSKK